MNQSLLFKSLVAVVAILSIAVMVVMPSFDSSLSGYATYENLIGRNNYITYAPNQQPKSAIVSPAKGYAETTLPDLGVMDIFQEPSQPSGRAAVSMITVVLKNAGPVLINTDPLKGGTRVVQLRITINNQRLLTDYPALYLEPGQSVSLSYRYEIPDRTPLGQNIATTINSKRIDPVGTKKVVVTLDVIRKAWEDANPANNRFEKKIDFIKLQRYNIP